MEAFIDKGYPTSLLEVLNNGRVYMKVILLSDISKMDGIKMTQWALRAGPNENFKWVWTDRRLPTSQNKKLWRDFLRRTFMKGMDELLRSVHGTLDNIYGLLAFPLFDYSNMNQKVSLRRTILQYPPELLSLLGNTYISDN